MPRIELNYSTLKFNPLNYDLHSCQDTYPDSCPLPSFIFLLLLHWPQRPSNQSSFDNRKSLTLEGVSCPPARQVVCQLAKLLETMKRIVMCRNESKTSQFACAFLSPIFILRTNTHTSVYFHLYIYPRLRFKRQSKYNGLK